MSATIKHECNPDRCHTELEFAEIPEETETPKVNPESHTEGGSRNTGNGPGGNPCDYKPKPSFCGSYAEDEQITLTFAVTLRNLGDESTLEKLRKLRDRNHEESLEAKRTKGR
jgi:hypothetical protein